MENKTIDVQTQINLLGAFLKIYEIVEKVDSKLLLKGCLDKVLCKIQTRCSINYYVCVEDMKREFQKKVHKILTKLYPDSEKFPVLCDILYNVLQALVPLMEKNRKLIGGDFRPCNICKGDDNPSKMILCDLCDDPYHIYCFRLPYLKVPTGMFYCEICESLVQNYNMIHRNDIKDIPRRVQVDEDEEINVEDNIDVGMPATKKGETKKKIIGTNVQLGKICLTKSKKNGAKIVTNELTTKETTSGPDETGTNGKKNNVSKIRKPPKNRKKRKRTNGTNKNGATAKRRKLSEEIPKAKPSTRRNPSKDLEYEEVESIIGTRSAGGLPQYKIKFKESILGVMWVYVWNTSNLEGAMERFQEQIKLLERNKRAR
eukprot:TRINITY_DN11296_c0_g1_i1.p1 TRINITY_DN11296_c0_g1~~TRINITY_DN11296_c0_g1_i1.p1  ORF type:complete len:372 (+),score=73.99 TRINITY_DN11296_c0_g1_i1:237-1352(+)